MTGVSSELDAADGRQTGCTDAGHDPHTGGTGVR